MKRFKRGFGVYGLMMISMGVGMLLVILLPSFGFLIGAALIGAGIWLSLTC